MRRRTRERITTILLHQEYAIVRCGCEIASGLCAPLLWLVGTCSRGDESWQFLDLTAILQILHVETIHCGLCDIGLLFKKSPGKCLIFSLYSLSFLLAVAQVETCWLVGSTVLRVTRALALRHRHSGLFAI